MIIHRKSPTSEYILENKVKQILVFKKNFGTGYNFIFCPNVIFFFFTCTLVKWAKIMQNWSLLSSKIHLCLSYTLKSFIKELDDKKLMSYHAYENVFDDITLSETEETFEK